ncbi:HD domain-containing phosphohydrolase [Paenibacillus sp. CAU 1782]
MSMRNNIHGEGRTLYRAFLRILLRNYLIGSTVAVFGFGGIIIYNTLSIPLEELVLLGGVLVLSLFIMLFCELIVFYRHMTPISSIFGTETPSRQQLRDAYLQTHRFPLLSVKRTFGPHFLGLSIPAASASLFLISNDWISLPYGYVPIAGAGALMVAGMHAMIEFFLTTSAIRPVLQHIGKKHFHLYGEQLTLGGTVIVPIRTKFTIGAFLIGMLPLVLFTLASQIRIDSSTLGSSALRASALDSSASYWQWTSIILLIGIAFSYLGATLLARNIQAPIATVQDAMSRVQDGQLEVRADDVYSDEFSRLIAGFNHMVDGLKERERRNDQLLQSYFFTLAAALDARDAYTAGHSERVAQFSVMIGRLAGWPEDKLDQVRKAALLHDIGKIGIRDNVLLKEGKLTEDEFEQIKRHPVLGENILKQIEPADAMAELLPGVRCHHERYDGKGYPDGLAGEQIPLLGRVIAIADAYDAMTSDRPYRRGMITKDALTILENGQGTQWDPALTKLFVEAMRGEGKNTA